MGSGASGPAGEAPSGELRLPATELRFSAGQLRALNALVDELCEEDRRGRMSEETESAVESLVQRIVDGAGQRDPRFRCCHLVALHQGKKMRSRSLEYLVTLDSLPALNSSEDCRLQDGPEGYGKIRLAGRHADKWAEFLTPGGYLCRDKVLEKWVELIARCAGARGGGGSRVLCARAAARAQPMHYCYLEREKDPQVGQERRLAIVEGAAWVMVRVGLGEAEAKLMLGARVEGVNAAAYTTRLPLTHPLALLHYSSARTGYYACAVGPPAGVVCAERAATWQLWAPALEASLDAHCGPRSLAARLAAALNALLDRARQGQYKGSLQLVSRYLAACALRRRLERCGGLAGAAARGGAGAHASRHLLLTLDDLVCVCERDGPAGYVFPLTRGDVSRRGARGARGPGGPWAQDAACLRGCLAALHALSPTDENTPPTASESLEMALFHRWEALNKEWRASSGGTGGTGGAGCSRRQLRYLWRAASELVACKNMIHVESHSNFRANLLQATTTSDQEAVEELVHILAIMLDQARDRYLLGLHADSCRELDKDLSAYRSKKWNKLKDYYDASSASLIDAARRDPRRPDPADPLALVARVLAWLQRGAREDRKYLGPVLRPYLDALLAAAAENSWLLDDFDETNCDDEFQGLKEYCAGVHGGTTEPCAGLLAGATRFAWAKALLDFLDRYKHVDFRLVFPTGGGLAVSFPVRVPSRRERSAARPLTLSRRDKAEAKLRLARRCVLAAFSDALSDSPAPALSRQSSDEVLSSARSGSYCAPPRPDVVPAPPAGHPRPARVRSSSSCGFPAISVSSESDTATLRRKYHTLRSLVLPAGAGAGAGEERGRGGRPRSAGARPSLLETLDFINSVKDALCVEESGLSEAEESAWGCAQQRAAGRAAPLNVLARRAGLRGRHLALGDLVSALLRAGKFSVLQELCAWLDEGREGALLALHRLARHARSRSSERSISSWRLPELAGEAESAESYRPRAAGSCSGSDEPAPPPRPPPPKHTDQPTKVYPDYSPPKRLQDLEKHLDYLEKVNSRLNLAPPNSAPRVNGSCTGVLHPVKIARDKFLVKRSKSLGRSWAAAPPAPPAPAPGAPRCHASLGRRSGQRTNDVVRAITTTTGETALEMKSNFFQRTTNNVIGDSYKLSRVTID